MKKPREDKVVTYVRLSESVVKKLDRLADREETDRSAIIRRIVIAALRDGEGKLSALLPKRIRTAYPLQKWTLVRPD